MEQKIIQKLEETKYTDSNLVEVKKNKDLNQKNYSEIVDNVQSEYLKNNDAMAGSSIAQDDYQARMITQKSWNVPGGSLRNLMVLFIL